MRIKPNSHPEETVSLPKHIDTYEWKFQQLKTQIHQELIESLDLAAIHAVDEPALRQQIQHLANEACVSRREPLSKLDRERLSAELMAEVDALSGKVVTQAEFDELAERATAPLMHDVGGLKSRVNDLTRRVGAMQMAGLQEGFESLGSPR